MRADWRRVFLYLAVAVMEGCWLYALLVLLDERLAGGRLAVWLLWLIYPVALAARRLLLRLRCPGPVGTAAGWVMWAAVVLLAVKIQLFGGTPWADNGWLLAIPRALAGIFYSLEPALIILAGGTVVWWLGWRLARLNVRFSVLVGEFQFGLVILLGVLFSASQLDIEMDNALPVVLVFFAFALAGIPAAHSLEGEGWLSGLYRGHWMGLLLLGIGLVILLGLLISWVVTPGFLQIIVGGLKWLWGLAVKVVMFIVSLFPEPKPGDIPAEAPEMGMSASENATIAERFSLPEWLRSGLKTGWSLMLLGVVVMALWRISSDVFGWMRRRLAGLAGAEYEAVPTTFGADILNLLRRVLRGLRRAVGFWRFRRRAAMLPEVAPVRQLYGQFLRWAAKAGCGRGAAQTPYEYLYAMAVRLPEAREDIAMMTQQYVAVRYGTFRPDEADIDRLRQCWQRLKKYRLKKTEDEGAH